MSKFVSRMRDCDGNVTRGRHPLRIQFSGGSASWSFSDGSWCWQSHQDPPRHSSCRCSPHAGQIMSPLFTPCYERMTGGAR